MNISKTYSAKQLEMPFGHLSEYVKYAIKNINTEVRKEAQVEYRNLC